MKTNSQVLGNLAATAKRTRSALHSLKDELLRKGLISDKEAKLLVEAGAVLARATPTLDRDKVTAKRKEEERQAFRSQMTQETRKAVEGAFGSLGIEDTVAFLVHLSPSIYSRRSDPIGHLREYLPLKSERYPNRENDVLREISFERNDALRGVVDELGWRAEGSAHVLDLVGKAKSDFEAVRPDILRRLAGFIAELNTAAVAQAIHKANKPGAGATGK